MSNPVSVSAPAWVMGDLLGLPLPAHAQALREGGKAFLTQAFRASGVLSAENCVAELSRCDEFLVGGTGSKAILDVRYEQPCPLPTKLFVKFSRNFQDPMRDQFRHMLAPEIRFAALSQIPDFPVAVPLCMLADFDVATGTGILITDRIAFGCGGIERQYQKCMDDLIPEPLAHYKAIFKALARLSGTHKAGRLPPSFDAAFPSIAGSPIAAFPISYSAEQIQRRVVRVVDFAAKFPRLLPENIAAAEFAVKLAAEVPKFLKHEATIRQYLGKQADYIALCHWNANIDNAWFWRNAAGELNCGLIDWTMVGQMPLAQSILGALSSADPELWNRHLRQLLAEFVEEFARCGGPELDLEELQLQLHLVAALMGLAHLLDTPAVILRELPDLATAKTRFDPQLRANENARVQLHMMTMLLNHWETYDFGSSLDRMLRKSNHISTSYPTT